jgi:hypothetical protein
MNGVPCQCSFPIVTETCFAYLYYIAHTKQNVTEPLAVTVQQASLVAVVAPWYRAVSSGVESAVQR